MAGQKVVSRYKICIFTEAAGLAGRWAGRWALGWERGARRRGAWGAQAGRAGRWAQARGLCAPGHAAGPTGCALSAPSLFFDSVLFLSHRLDTVREHRS